MNKTEKEDSFLAMNKEVLELEEKKLEVADGILEVLRSIDTSLKKLVPEQTALELFSQMQTEQ